MGELYDFIEHKMYQLMVYADDMERPDIASQIDIMLNEYLIGNIDITFVDGWPVAYPTAQSDKDT
tara:strand:- start:7334 stop:7528 length:195 start_codon:yes stop_codon:yes gene_type:complete